MSKYETYKPSGIDWIGDVPSTWKLKRLKDFTLKILGGGTPTTGIEKYWDDEKTTGIPWVAIADITKAEVIIDTDKFITAEGLAASSTQLIEKGKLLYSIYASIGKVAVAGRELATNQAILSIYENPILSNVNYLKYCLKGIEDIVGGIGSSTTQNNINLEKLRSVKFPLPPRDEQLTIANYLDHQTQKIDRLIANKKAQAEKLKELRQITINNAANKGLNPNAEFKDSSYEWLGKIPSHWEVRKIKQLLRPEKNAIKTGPFGSDLKFEDLIEEGIKVYNQRSVLDNDWESGEGYISEKKYETLKTCTIFPDDMVITTRGTIGKVSIFPSNAELGILHPCLMRIQMNSQRILNDYLKIVINDSSFFFEALKLASNATTIDVIYSESLKEVKIPLPPIQEQIKITSYLQKRITSTDKLIKNIQTQIEKLQELRKIKIYEAVTGKIKVNAYVEATA